MLPLKAHSSADRCNMLWLNITRMIQLVDLAAFMINCYLNQKVASLTSLCICMNMFLYISGFIHWFTHYLFARFIHWVIYIVLYALWNCVWQTLAAQLPPLLPHSYLLLHRYHGPNAWIVTTIVIPCVYLSICHHVKFHLKLDCVSNFIFIQGRTKMQILPSLWIHEELWKNLNLLSSF